MDERLNRLQAELQAWMAKPGMIRSCAPYAKHPMSLAEAKPLLISTTEALESAIQQARQQPWVALDTEFMREQTYFPQLCLVQIAAGSTLFLIDPLALEDLSALGELLADASTLKVLHAADQDVEVLLHATGQMPVPLFDTQLAAMLLGHGEQIGYAPAVQRVLGTQLGKTHQRTDWSRRPLDAQELAYAADDVRYLSPLYESLQGSLQSLGREQWLAGDFARLTDASRYSVQPQDAWRKLKGLNKLRPREQQLAGRLAAWREARAIERNRPRRWILKDDVLLDIARRKPGTAEDLQRIRGLPERMAKQPEELLGIVREAPSLPAEPLIQAADRLDPALKPVVDLLTAQLQAASLTSGIAASALATRRDLEALASGERNLPLLEGWRREAAGASLLALLEGGATLQVQDHQVVLNPQAD